MRTVLYDEIQDSILCKEYPYKGCEIVSADSIFRNPPQLDVSVIVPCYNVERFLPECIESLAAQKTQYTYEVILINDGSTDGTRELAEDAAKRYPVFHCIHQDNQGCGAARNQGMRNAKGEYLLFVDADDTTSSERQVMKYNKLNPEYRIQYTCGKAVSSSDNVFEIRDLLRLALQRMYSGSSSSVSENVSRENGGEDVPGSCAELTITEKDSDTP